MQAIKRIMTEAPFVVAGGGLAGLSAAIHLAAAGRRVILLEQSDKTGGRGLSREAGGWTFNLGAHAIYNAGPGKKMLTELGVRLEGKTPPVTGVQAFVDGRIHPLLGPWLSPAEKLRLPLLIARIMTLRAQDWKAVPAADWLDGLVGQKQSALRKLMGFLVRVSTYCAAQDRLSAEVAIGQLQLAIRANVTYLDGGWSSLVDQLTRLARRQGVEIVTDSGLKGLQYDGSWLVETAQRQIRAAGVILALPPQAIARLLAPWPELELHRQIAALEPVTAACLDIGLTSLPRPRHSSAFGMDEPAYFSVHSNSAKLAPEGAALIHSLWYLDQPIDPQTLRTTFEHRLDQFQPGWQKRLGPSFYYPHLTVTHALATPGKGLAGRPPIEVKGLPNLLLAGDWVGESGWLADAALVSGREAAGIMAKLPLMAGAAV